MQKQNKWLNNLLGIVYRWTSPDKRHFLSAHSFCKNSHVLRILFSSQCISELQRMWKKECEVLAPVRMLGTMKAASRPYCQLQRWPRPSGSAWTFLITSSRKPSFQQFGPCFSLKDRVTYSCEQEKIQNATQLSLNSIFTALYFSPADMNWPSFKTPSSISSSSLKSMKASMWANDYEKEKYKGSLQSRAQIVGNQAL